MGLKGEKVAQVDTLVMADRIAVDRHQLSQLFTQLGEAGAEDVVLRAMEELALRLTHCEQLLRSQSLTDLRKCARSMIAIAEQVGMNTLACVARDVTYCVDSGDPVALTATTARLVRTGERSLSEIWDLQNLSL